MAEFTLRIDGMHCGSCVRRVAQALAGVEGVEADEVRIGAARLHSATEPVPAEKAIEALGKIGFHARLEN